MGAEAVRHGRRRVSTGKALGSYLDPQVTVAYCLDAACPGGRVFATRPPNGVCVVCRGPIALEGLRWRVEVRAPRFGEVRLHFGFQPAQHRYRWIARVRDDAVMPDGGVFTVHHPLIQRPERALTAAQEILEALGRISCPAGAGEVARGGPRILHLDAPREAFSRQLLEIVGESTTCANGGMECTN